MKKIKSTCRLFRNRGALIILREDVNILKIYRWRVIHRKKEYNSCLELQRGQVVLVNKNRRPYKYREQGGVYLKTHQTNKQNRHIECYI